MDPAYATYDPALLYMTDSGLMMPDETSIAEGVPIRSSADGGEIMPYEESETDWAWLRPITDIFGNVIRTVGEQAPNVILDAMGRPTPTSIIPMSTAPTGLPFGLSPMALLLIGGVAYFAFFRKK